MRKTIALLALFVCSLSVSDTKADIVLFDIDADPGGWTAAIAGFTPSTGFDFGLDPDYGIEGFDGPVGNAGGGPVGAGTIGLGITIDSETDGPGGGSRGAGGTGLVAVGASAGFGNPSNFLGANFFNDSLRLDFDSAQIAFEFNVVSLLGSDTVDILVTDDSGVQTLFAGIAAPGFGHNIGLLGINGMNISSVSIFDTGTGAEGFQGVGQAYINAIPEPGSAALLGFLALALAIHRRRK